MSVISKNPFDLLGDDGDSPSPAPAPKPAAAPAPAAQQPKVVPGAQPRAGNQRGGRYPPRGAPRNANNRNGERRGEEGALPSSEGVTEGNETAGGFDGERIPPSRKAHHGPDSHTKGPRGSRPARGSGHGAARVPAQGGERRQYERRSGTYGDSEKKIAQGWGADEGEAELNAEVAGEKDAIAEETAPGTPAPEAETAEETATPAAPAVPEEPEEVLKSYDEYLAEKAAQALADGLGKKEARKVEGETLEGKAFRREAVDDFFAAKEKTSAPKTKAAKKEKVFLEFEGRFAAPAGSRPPRPEGGDRETRGGGGAGGERGGRGRGGPRGGRGGDRGGRGRGSAPSRGGRSTGPAPVDASDEKAFPALGA